MPNITRRGLLMVLSSPSGAGKTTLSRLLVEEEGLELSISMTTRQRRPSEVDGVHYFFTSVANFERKRDSDQFLEWASVHGNYYGTLREPVEQALAAGRDMLFDIDYQGAEQLRTKLPEDVVSLFILPPTMKELKSRLNRRAEDAPQVIATRLDNARVEMSHWRGYDYIVVNRDLDATFKIIKAIYRAETVKSRRATNLPEFIDSLINENVDE